jgi:glucose-6-phosphate isomerase
MPDNAWKMIEQLALKPLEELFATGPDRLSRLSQEVAGVYFDWSKTHLDGELIDAFRPARGKERVRYRP